MSRHFGAQHIKNGYAAMGGALNRPIYSGMNSKRSVGEAIAAERARAQAEARRKKK